VIQSSQSQCIRCCYSHLLGTCEIPSGELLGFRLPCTRQTLAYWSKSSKGPAGRFRGWSKWFLRQGWDNRVLALWRSYCCLQPH